jgi:ABC-type amino acid transport substrate-binding protein
MRILLAMLVVLVMASAAQAQTYVVGVEDINYYPLYDGKSGEYTGYAREVLDAFAESKGYTFEYKALPIKRLFTFFLGGELDFKFPDNAYWSADSKEGKKVVYSDPVVSYIDGVSVQPDRVGMTSEEMDTMGIVRGFTAWEYLTLIENGQVRLEENNDFQSMLQMVLRGRADGAYGNVAVVNYQLAEMGKEGGLVFEPALPHTKSAYHLSTIAHPGVVAEFNEWMLTNAEKVDELKAKYDAEKGVE